MLGPPSNVPQAGRRPCSDWRATLTAVPFTSTIAFTTSARTCVVALLHTSASVPGLAAGPASRPLLHYGDQFDLDHRLGLGEAADRRAGWSGDAGIAHAHIAALREGFVVGDEGIGLDHIGPGGAGSLEAGIPNCARMSPGPTILPPPSRASWPAV